MRNLPKFFLPVLFLFLAGSKLQAQDENVIKTGITKVYEMFSSGDFTHLGDYIDENMIDHSPFPGQKPGLEGLKEAFGKFRNAYPDMKFTVNDVIIKDNKASVLFTFAGTNSGEMMGMKATGKSVSIQGIDYMYFNKEGKATEHWGYIDSDALMQQLGMMPQGDMGKDKK